MVSSMEMAGHHAKVTRNIYLRRAYAARRALTAIDNYAALVFSPKPAAEKERAFRWMKAWMALAVDRQC